MNLEFVTVISVPHLQISMRSFQNNSWVEDVHNLLQRLRTLVEEEPLTEKYVDVLIKILEQFGLALSMIPSEDQEIMKVC